MERTKLFRSAVHVELESIRRTERFLNPPGIEVKYVATSLGGARTHAMRAAAPFGDGPFVVVETSIATAEIGGAALIVVDGGVETVVLRSAHLKGLAPPKILPTLG